MDDYLFIYYRVLCVRVRNLRCARTYDSDQAYSRDPMSVCVYALEAFLFVI